MADPNPNAIEAQHPQDHQAPASSNEPQSDEEPADQAPPREREEKEQEDDDHGDSNSATMQEDDDGVAAAYDESNDDNDKGSALKEENNADEEEDEELVDDEEDEEDTGSRPRREKEIDEEDDDSANDDKNDNDDDDDGGSASDDNGSRSGESSSDDEDEGEADDNGLSEYEKLRLQRIERNKQYLAKLGLENKPLLGKPAPQQKRKKKAAPEAPMMPSRTSLARRTKSEKMNYAIPTRIFERDDEAGTAASGLEGKETSGGTSERGAEGDAVSERRRPAKLSAAYRLDITLHREFIRIRSSKRAALKEVKRCLSRSEKEIKYWERMVQVHEKRKAKLEKQMAEQAAREQEFKALGNITMKDLLHEVDKRMPEMLHAAHRYDNTYNMAKAAYDRSVRQTQMEKRALLIRAFEEYPKALASATTILNSVLLERAPKDPPPPRRSKRSMAEEEQEEEPKKKKARTSKKKKEAKDDPNAPEADPALSTVVETTVDLPTAGSNDEDDEDEEATPHTKDNEKAAAAAAAAAVPEEAASTATPAKTPKKKKHKAKIVGGWVSPGFANCLDRQWLLKPGQNETEPSHYVPQVGDAVLYYPAGHKVFLESFPDILGKKTRQVTRIALWEKATAEQKKIDEENKASKPVSSEQADGGAEQKIDEEDNTSKPASSEQSQTDGGAEQMKIDEEDNTSKPTSSEQSQADGGAEQKKIDDEDNTSKPTFSEQSQADGGRNKKPSTSKRWWTQEWIDALNKKDGEEGEEGAAVSAAQYPILCIVQATSAEFPPDSNKVSKRQSEDGTHEVVYNNDPKGQKKKKNKKKIKITVPKLRLAVSLRPLTPIKSLSEDSSKSRTELPPAFAVVTFPSKSHRPYLLPFGWAYTTSHSMKIGDHVKIASEKAAAQPRKIERFVSHDSQRLTERVSDIQALFNRFGGMRAAITADSDSIPAGDVAMVLNTLDAFVKRSGTGADGADENAPKSPPSLWELICSTLPLWDSVSLCNEPSSADNDKTRVSPWDLVASPPPKRKKAKKEAPAPTTVVVSPTSTLDESLRLKLCESLQQFIQGHPSAPFFVEVLTDEIAPSYSCAVPTPMYFELILSRLGVDEDKTKSFYRGVGGLLSDIALIRENCLLYNDPESEVVEKAIEFVAAAKDVVLNVVKSHNKEVSEVRKADEERQRLVLLHCASSKQTESASMVVAGGGKSVAVCRVKNPFKQEIEHSWLQQIHPDALFNEKAKSGRTSHVGWIPQAGDSILYSRKRHAKFVMSHYPSLETEQCSVPTFESDNEESDNDNDKDEDHKQSATLAGNIPNRNSDAESDWETATVRWTRATYPKTPSKRSADDALTFTTNATLLAIGVYFENGGKVETVYWRPCMFNFDKKSSGSCAACGLSLEESFIQLDSNVLTSNDDGDSAMPQQQSSNTAKIYSTLSTGDLQSLHKCITLLKRKILRGDPPSTLDESLSKQSISEGYTPAPPKIGVKSLPSYADLLMKRSEAPHGTRKQGARETVVEETLVSRAYIPPWLNDEESKEKLPLWYDTISPWSRLSLELIELRLERGFYRHREAVENDIVEAWGSTSFLLLAQAAARKKSPLSIKRVGNRLKTKGKTQSTEDGGGPTEEEEIWATRLGQVRELYAAALVCVTNTSSVERLCFAPPSMPETEIPLFVPPQEDSVRADARKKLAHILEALGRDPLKSFTHLKSGIGEKTLKIVCGNETVTIERYHQKIKSIPATMGEKEVSVKVKLGREAIFGLKDSPSQETAEAELDGTNVSVRVVCDGEDVLLPLLPAASLATTKEDRVRFHDADFEVDEGLSQAFFGRAGRAKPCGRCQAYRRSLLSCRVRRNHSNPDFDWVGFFSDIGGLDNLLIQMDPDHQLPDPSPSEQQSDPVIASSSQIDPEGTDSESKPLAKEKASEETTGGNNPRVSKESQEKDVDANDESKDGTAKGHSKEGTKDSTASGHSPMERMEGTGAGTGNDKKPTIKQENAENTKQPPDVDPSEMLERATLIRQKAEALLVDVQNFVETPDIMSEEFVRESIPVDENDGHYIYCVVCGLSGDLLCCDACPNVVHANCVNTAVPDGNWYCEECDLLGRIPGREAKKTEHAVLPFGRSPFKDDLVDSLVDSLNDLQKFNRERPSKPPPQPQPTQKGKDAPAPKKTQERKPARKTPFDVLSATTKEFLKTVGIETADELVATRTTKLGTSFREWRKKKEMSQMKTNGEIASVSVWKRACRDAAKEMNVELKGDTGGGVVWKDEVESSSDEDEEPDEAWGAKPRRESSTRGKSFKDLDDPIEALSEMAIEFFRSIGITSAEKLLASKTSEVALRFGKWRRKKKLAKLKGSGEVATISAWKTTTRNAAEAIEATKAASSRSKRAEKRSRDAKDERKKKDKASKPSEKTFVGTNALDALSGPPREFLKSINVQSAKQFMALRTCDVAEDFAIWRQEQGLPKLRGSGNGATISAWRTLCRNAMEQLQASDGEEEQEDEAGNLKEAKQEAASPRRKKRKTTRSNVTDVEEV